MNGTEVYKFAVQQMPKAVGEALRRADLTADDVDFVIPHQANLRIIDSVAVRLGVPKDKFFVNVQRYGNTSSASIPVALYEAVEAGRVRPGDLGVLSRSAPAIRGARARSAGAAPRSSRRAQPTMSRRLRSAISSAA